MAVKDTSKVSVTDLTEAQGKAEHARLEADIAAHDRRYYEEDAPTVSDRHPRQVLRAPEIKTDPCREVESIRCRTMGAWRTPVVGLSPG